MPVTPLHFGPGLGLRAAFGPRFGLLGYLASQVLLDLEPGLKLFGLAPEGGGLHEWHTWAWAPLFMALAAWLAWWVGRVGQRLVFAEARLGWLRSSFWSETAGASVGVLTHLGLDALYHSDVAAGLGLPGASAVFPPETIDLALLLFLPVSAVWLWFSHRTTG